MKGVGAKSRKPSISKSERSLSRKSVSRRPSTQKSPGRFLSMEPTMKSVVKLKRSSGSKLKSRHNKRNIPKLRIKIFKSDLGIHEDSLFMLFEVFHDIINDDRGNTTHKAVVKSNLEEKLKSMCGFLLGLNFEFGESAELNSNLNSIYKDILDRLTKGRYADFEKRFHLQLIDFIKKKNSNLQITDLKSETYLGRIAYIFHDAGFEDLYTVLAARSVSTVGNIDQWTRHPGDKNDPENYEDIRNTLISLRDFSVSAPVTIDKLEAGNHIRLLFNYFNIVDGKLAQIPVFIRIFLATATTYQFSMSVGDESNFSFIPNEKPRKHCYSVTEAKEHLHDHFVSGCPICSGTPGVCNEVLKIFAMKAIGDKVTFLDAKINGTIDFGAQAAAVTHDRLASAYLIRDMDKRLEKRTDYRLKSNLVIPVIYYNWQIGRGGGLQSDPGTKRTIIIHERGAGAFSTIGQSQINQQSRINSLRESSIAYHRGAQNSINHIRDYMRKGHDFEKALSLISEKFESSMGPGKLDKKTKKKPKKKRLKKKQRTLRKKSK